MGGYRLVDEGGLCQMLKPSFLSTTSKPALSAILTEARLESLMWARKGSECSLTNEDSILAPRPCFLECGAIIQDKSHLPLDCIRSMRTIPTGVPLACAMKIFLTVDLIVCWNQARCCSQINASWLNDSARETGSFRQSKII